MLRISDFENPGYDHESLFPFYLSPLSPVLASIPFNYFGSGLRGFGFVSIHLTVGASLKSFKNTVQALSGKAEWQLVQEGRDIDERLFPIIKTHPVIQAAAPVIEFKASLYRWPDQTILIMGVDFFSETGIRRYSDSLSSLKGEELLALLTIPLVHRSYPFFRRPLWNKKRGHLDHPGQWTS